MKIKRLFIIIFSIIILVFIGYVLLNNSEESVIDNQEHSSYGSETISSWDSPSTAIEYEQVGDPKVDFLNHAMAICSARFDIYSFDLNDNVVTIELENNSFNDTDIRYIKDTVKANMTFYEVEIDNLEINVVSKQ